MSLRPRRFHLSFRAFRAFVSIAATCAAALAPSSSAATEYTYTWANPTPQGNALWGTAFEDAAIGYAVGEKGAVLRTMDGGASWVDLTQFGSFDASLYDVCVLAPGELLAAGDAPGIYFVALRDAAGVRHAGRLVLVRR